MIFFQIHDTRFGDFTCDTFSSETSETQAIDHLFLPQQLRGIQVVKHMGKKPKPKFLGLFVVFTEIIRPSFIDATSNSVP